MNHVGVTFLRLSDVSAICRVTYFQFSIQSAFLPWRSARRHSAYLVYPVSDIRRCRKFVEYVSCTERTAKGNDSGLYNGKMETRQPSHRSTLLSLNFVKFGRDGKSANSCVIYRTKNNKISAASQTFDTARIAPKICQGQLRTMYLAWSRFNPYRFTFGIVIAERMNTTTRRVNLIL